MNKKSLIILIVLLMAGIAAATVLFVFPYDPLIPPIADDTGSTPDGIQEVVNANNQFAFDLYSKITESEQGNIFFSPYSISSALAITYEGAKGQTSEEMKSVFHFPEQEILRPNFAAIYNKINKRQKDYEIRTGNALWVQEDFPLDEHYRQRVENHYGAKAANLDFIREPEKSRQTINSFIEQQTNRRIKDLIPQGLITRDTALVLTNAIYFNGNWQWEFNRRDTREMDFKISEDNIVRADMMYMKPDKASFNYAYFEQKGLKILELPYKGEDISMLILLPDHSFGDSVKMQTLDGIEHLLTAEKLEEFKAEMKKARLDGIYLPKFEFDKKYFMEETLIDMGMPSAFDSGKADFSGMSDEKIWISDVIHQAFVKVDERGTEAAAATALMMIQEAAGPDNIFRADRPFIFIIQEKKTGNILFMGRVVDPTE